jgi:glycosyltransferase involved in cell wall biosynthesis
MIVKNEAHIITRCLESVKPFIDYWVICDNGSTDNTEQVVRECLKDIPGQFVKTTWKDFATNRNEALDYSKNRADYSLIIDADDMLIATPTAFDCLTQPAYKIKIKMTQGSLEYERIQLVSNLINAKYYGVIHECISVNIEAVQRLEGCHIVVSHDGARSTDPTKYLKDANILEKAILDEPHNPRYVFYAAQSYRCAGCKQQAYDLYTKRATMPGWEQERYVAILESAKLAETLYPEKAEDLYIKAHNVLPNRAEAMVYLAAFCRKRNKWDKAYLYATIANCVSTFIKSNSNDLFIETDCYNWKAKDELSIAAYYIGKQEEGKLIIEKLLSSSSSSSSSSSNLLPQSQIERIKNNLEYYR